MKFKKFGKALLMSALSAGVVLSVTSCVQSYTVGYLYVTGTVTAGTAGSGIISGFKIDHNTGELSTINGLPVSSGGSNPVRAVLLTGSRFLYVLNRGANASGGSECTTADPCQNANITQFAVGGNGILTPQETFFPQGINPFRLISDSTGNYLMTLDHDAPSAADCQAALAIAGPCGDITIFQINQTTGRLQLVINAQVSSAGGSALTYFPVPANPIDFAVASNFVLTVSAPSAASPWNTVFPYAYNGSNGQLTISQNSNQPMTGITQATAIVVSGGTPYILDNEPPAAPNTTGASSQIFPFSVGANGALQAMTGGAVPDDPTLSNPIYLLVENKGKFLYVANQGNDTNTTNAESGIAGYVIDPTTHELSFIAGEPFGSGAGPQCLVEDPSNQYVYTANFNDSTVTGRAVDPNSGVLNDLRVAHSYPVTGPPTWCLVDGRTN
jgi:6-phosphogluconolactonase (cycloisomerase 2 family)